MPYLFGLGFLPIPNCRAKSHLPLERNVANCRSSSDTRTSLPGIHRGGRTYAERLEPDGGGNLPQLRQWSAWRASIIAARHRGRLTAPMLFEGTTDAGVFNLWLKARLLPELPERAVLVMDNAAKACRRLDGNPDVPECKGVSWSNPSGSPAQARSSWPTLHWRMPTLECGGRKLGSSAADGLQ